MNGSPNWFIVLKREDLLLNSAESVLDRSIFHRYDLRQLLEDSCHRSNGMDCIIELFTTMDIEFADVNITLHGNVVSSDSGFLSS